ncbi:MAG: hypothetical protein AB1925_01795 [Actinomycetota bacterium]
MSKPIFFAMRSPPRPSAHGSNLLALIGWGLPVASIQTQTRLTEEPHLRSLRGEPKDRSVATTGRLLPVTIARPGAHEREDVLSTKPVKLTQSGFIESSSKNYESQTTDEKTSSVNGPPSPASDQCGAHTAVLSPLAGDNKPIRRI